MVEHFRSRTDMILWLIKNCPRPAIVRALEFGNVEFLGGFSPIPPSDLPGWIFKVRTGHVKNVCILANDAKQKYEIRIVKRVPWGNWCGVFHGVLMTTGLNVGDNPIQYKELKDATTSERSSKDM